MLLLFSCSFLNGERLGKKNTLSDVPQRADTVILSAINPDNQVLVPSSATESFSIL